jgi:hypothetical protein
MKAKKNGAAVDFRSRERLSDNRTMSYGSELQGDKVVGQFDTEASQTRDYFVAKNPSVACALSGQAATQRAARLDPSLRLKNGYAQDDKVV